VLLSFAAASLFGTGSALAFLSLAIVFPHAKRTYP
jgi:hypothetical protein